MSTFRYVLVPANSSAGIVIKTGKTAGGLERDELVQSAKDYFFQQSDAAEHVIALKNATPEVRNALAEKFRKQNSNPQIQSLPNDQILQLMEANTNPSCEIVALTVPTKGNGHEAVSLYISPFTDGAVLNERASGMVLALGHSLPEAAGQKQPGIYGDVFIGRAYDNEEEEWKRLDLTPEDLMPYSPWIKVARTPGGGGGSGSNKAAPSLSGSMKQVQLGDSPAASPPENKDLGYAWSQTDDEVELKFKCESGVKGKDVQIKFGRTTLKVEISGKTLADGAMGGVIVVDESTYTLQDEGKGRELCIVLTKAEEGRLWPHAVQN